MYSIHIHTDVQAQVDVEKREEKVYTSVTVMQNVGGVYGTVIGTKRCGSGNSSVMMR